MPAGWRRRCPSLGRAAARNAELVAAPSTAREGRRFTPDLTSFRLTVRLSVLIWPASAAPEALHVAPQFGGDSARLGRYI
jgi:hypothetical protein